MENIQYLTDEGAKKLSQRLRFLKEERLPELLDQIREIVLEGGGYDESPEYSNVRAEQEFVESEIDRLENLLREAQIINLANNHHEVRLGNCVTVIEKGSMDSENYQLVSSAEANPREGRISVASPLGHALLGAKVGDEVMVAAPDGEIIFIIKAIH